MENEGSSSDASINEDQACDIAKEAIDRESKVGGPSFALWSKADLGDAILVMTIHHEPSYWLFPVKIRGKIAGFVRVLRNGRVAQVGSFSSSPGIIKGPPIITGISQEQAIQKVGARIHLDRDERFSDPVFVHDGPIGMEAWLIEVIKESVPCRRIFVTPTSIYEHAAGMKQIDRREL